MAVNGFMTLTYHVYIIALKYAAYLAMGVSYNCKFFYNIAWKHGYITPTPAFLATAVSYGCIFCHWPSLFKHAALKGAAYLSTALTCFIKFHNFFKKTLAWRHTFSNNRN
jgi:hypothetical protein